MKPRCTRSHILPEYIPARALVTACTRCSAIVPVPKRRHLSAVRPAGPLAPVAAAPVAPVAPRPRQLSAREKMIRADFSDYIDYLEQTSEINLNGVLYSRAGQAAAAAGRIRQRDLYVKPWHQMRRYASEELIEFFDEFGRMTWTEYRAQFKNERQEAAG